MANKRELSRADLLAIKAELQNDPAGLGYAGKDDGEQARLLTEPLPGTTQGPVASATFLLYLLKAGKISTAGMSLDDTVKRAVEVLLSPNVAALNAADATTLCDELVAGSVITAGDRTAILATGLIPSTQSRLSIILPTATEAGVEDVTEAKVTV